MNKNDVQNNIMLDIETLGKKPGCVVLSIGACYFDPKTGETGHEFYEEINLESSLYMGRKIEAKTLKFWNTEGLVIPLGGVDAMIHVLNRLHKFILSPGSSIGPGADPYGENRIIWCNGASFDIPILEYEFRENGYECDPWKYWNVRDVRTLITVAGIDKGDRYNTHNALLDCKNQISWVVDAFKKYSFK